MTTRELERLAGRTLPTKLVFVPVGERLFHRETADHWHEYSSGAAAIAEGKDAADAVSSVGSTFGTGATIRTPGPVRLSDSTLEGPAAPDKCPEAKP